MRKTSNLTENSLNQGDFNLSKVVQLFQKTIKSCEKSMKLLLLLFSCKMSMVWKIGCQKCPTFAQDFSWLKSTLYCSLLSFELYKFEWSIFENGLADTKSANQLGPFQIAVHDSTNNHRLSCHWPFHGLAMFCKTTCITYGKFFMN